MNGWGTSAENLAVARECSCERVSRLTAQVPQPKNFHDFACTLHDPPGPSTAASMVRHYIRKGGHGGKRDGAGLKPEHWERQGGRKAASAARMQRVVAQKAAAVKAMEQWSEPGDRGPSYLSRRGWPWRP